MSTILHLDCADEPSFTKPVEVSTTDALHGSAAALFLLLNTLKQQFVNLCRDHPISVWKQGDSQRYGDIEDAACKDAICTFLSKVAAFIKYFAPAYFHLRKDLVEWHRTITTMLVQYNDLAKRVGECHRDLLGLRQMCSAYIKCDSCFQARVKFDRSFTMHMKLMQECRAFETDASLLLAHVRQRLQLVDFASRFVHFVAMVYEYITAVTRRLELLCLVRKAQDYAYVCRGHPHYTIKTAYMGVVSSYNKLPLPAECTPSLHSYATHLETVATNTANGKLILAADYSNCLLPLQMTLDEEIRSKEARLGEGVVWD